MGGRKFIFKNIYKYYSWVLVKEIAPEPISNINPIVKIRKNKIAITQPKIFTWYSDTAKGIMNNNSKSNIKKLIATI